LSIVSGVELRFLDRLYAKLPEHCQIVQVQRHLVGTVVDS